MATPAIDLKEEQSKLQKEWGDDYSKNIKDVKFFVDSFSKRMLEYPLVDTAEGILFLFNVMKKNTNNILPFKKLN